MGHSLRILTIRGIDIRVHVTFPLILLFAVLQFGVWTGQGLTGALFGIVVTLLLFTIVALHELGHSMAAQHYGVSVSQIALLPIGGVAQIDGIPENPRQELVIALAGPLVNGLIAFVLFLAHRGFGWGGAWPGDMMELVTGVGQGGFDAVFNYIFAANLLLAIFNLIPAFPMDGGRVLRALLAIRLEYSRATAIAVSISQTLAALGGVWGLLEGDLFLIVIALFVYMGAGQEGDRVRLKYFQSTLRIDHVHTL